MIPSLHLQPGFLEGWVRHKRYKPRPHEFKFNKIWVCIDVDEFHLFGADLPYWKLNTFGLHTLSRLDFLGSPNEPIRISVTRLCREHGLTCTLGQILAIVACKNLGLSQNPAEFYLVHDIDANLIAIVTNLKNRQGEAYPYTLLVQDQKNLYFECEKALYISGHTPMDVLYKWQFYIGKRHFVAQMSIETPPIHDEPLVNSLLFPVKAKRDQKNKIIMEITLSSRLKQFTPVAAKELGIRYALSSITSAVRTFWNRLALNENGIGTRHPATRGEEHPRRIAPPKQVRKPRLFR